MRFFFAHRISGIFTRRGRGRIDRDQIEYRYARIGDLCVTESCRGSGIGRALIAACEARTSAAGVSRLTIRHDPQNVRPAQFYASLGYGAVQVVREKVLG